ncbi:VWA domain-containing protein [Paenibacillus amylolyticus]|nr:VWA domain-containing protein [Paenibacillus amylolyticus]
MNQEEVEIPQSGNGESETQAEVVHHEGKKVLKPNVSKRLILSIAAVLLIGGAAGLWYWNEVSGVFNIQVTVNSNKGSEAKMDPAVSITPEPISITNEPAKPVLKPAYIQVNQVDSSKYENGEVDVYFSLFSDNEFSNSLDSASLTKDMFKVNGLPVSYVSQVNQIDTVSVDLVLDKSGSMMEPPNGFMNQSKMELVRNAAIQFLENVPHDAKGKFGLLTFSSFAPEVADIAFNSDRQHIASYLSTLESDNGRTALYDSLTKALYDTNLQMGPKYIIAFTDGIDSEDSDYGSSAQSVIDLSKQLGIPIYTIGFGDAFTDLQSISEETGGSYFSIHEEDNLQLELQTIYESVFQKYVKQYKLTYRPEQKVSPGEEFPISLQMDSPVYTAQTSTLEFTRKIEATSIEAMNGLFEYQVNYANAVNNLDFSLVSNNVSRDSDFYNNLKNRIEKDYVSLNNQGKPKIIDPLENYRTESIVKLADGSYKIEFFKLFPLELNQERVYEADLNTYTLEKDSYTGKWQVNSFGRSECSIYTNKSDPGSSCKNVNGTTKLYSQDPWARVY